MRHSRPGFATRTSDAEPAALNNDMVPALHRATKAAAPSPLKFDSTVLEAQMEAHKREHPVMNIAPAPEVLVNPTPSATPLVNEPGK